MRAGLAMASVVLVLASCSEGKPQASMTRVPTTVTRVVDGDTIHVTLDGRDVTVRLIGIDTPEKDGPYTHAQCHGDVATGYTTARLEGRSVELEFDVDRTDRYDRTLAYVWLQGQLFNEQLLRDGIAVVDTFPPNVRYLDRFTKAQDEARAAERALWSACSAA
jgi:micrococcal nuclease